MNRVGALVSGLGLAVLVLVACPEGPARAEGTGRGPSGNAASAGSAEPRQSLSPEFYTIDWVVDSALAHPDFRGCRASVLVQSLETGAVLYERYPDVPRIPASNMKVVTGAASLSVLGPDYRFTTTLLTDAPEPGRTLSGNLYVRGTGDPSFVSEELWKLVEEIRVLGIETITGDVVLDATWFDTLTTTSDSVADGDRAYHARTGALSVNFNAIAVHTVPGSRPGSPTVVSLAPKTAFVDVRNEATTGRAGGRSSLSVRRTFEKGRNVLKVTGTVPAGSGKSVHYRNLDDGPGYFGALLVEFMADEGIAVEGTVVEGTVPEGARVLVEHRSKPLSLIVRDLNKFSNNFVAEQLLKAMAAETSGPPGSTAGGVAVLEEHLSSAGADSGSYHVEDGSGFSRENRLSVRAITKVIARALSDFSTSYEFAASLSVSGTDGTLEDRMGYPGLEREVRAKTGLLDGVTAISGIMRTSKSGEVVFSIILNGFTCEAWRAHDLEHSILGVIARG